MEINRNNYEEYFLLYADNELSPTEKKVVEIFVQENVDLKEEFLMIKMTVNSPEEDVKLTDKSFLLKKEPSFINENNHEEVFVRYHDNELSDDQKIETKKFLAENLKYKSDFELIGKAKLLADNSIIYPDKKELYRKEKSGKVIPLILWRATAAAVFIGFGLWITIYYSRNAEKNAPAVAQINKIKPTEEKEKNAVQKPVTEENKIASLGKPEAKIKTEKTEIKKSVVRPKDVNDIAVVKPNFNIKKPILKEEIKEGKPAIENQTIAITNPVKNAPPFLQNEKNQIAANQAAVTINEMEPEIQNPQVHTVSYAPDVSTDNQNYVFYDVPAEEFRKSKVGGFIKKVRRIVERNNPITRIFNGEEEQMAAK
jgi:hypothetical protein